MEKPSGFDEVQINEGFERPNLGGHYAIIKQVNEKVSSTGKKMLVILFDFEASDKQAGMFMKQYNEDTIPDKKYPNTATHYMLIDSSESFGTRNLKSFITCVENSNSGFKVQWGDNFLKQFAGKKIGCVFGEQLDFYNNKEVKKTVLRWFCSWDKVKDAEIPEITETKEHKNMKNHPIANPENFMQIADGVEELPFA